MLGRKTRTFYYDDWFSRILHTISARRSINWLERWYSLFYKELHCNPKNKVDNLNQSIRQVINRHTIPNHFPLFSIDECNDPVLIIKRVNFDPFSKVKIGWSFQKVLVSYNPSNYISTSKVMYMTVELRKLVLSVVNTVVAFVVLPFRPILDFRYMYVGKDNNVVFFYY